MKLVSEPQNNSITSTLWALALPFNYIRLKFMSQIAKWFLNMDDGIANHVADDHYTSQGQEGVGPIFCSPSCRQNKNSVETVNTAEAYACHLDASR